MKIWKRKPKKMPSPKNVMRQLQREIGYADGDLYLTENNTCLIIKSIVVMSIEEGGTVYYVSFSSGTTALGTGMIIDCLHKFGVTNLVFKENFYIGHDKYHPELPKTYYGEKADEEYNNDLRKKISIQIKAQMQGQFPHMFQVKSTQTLH
jgi:hypothetical protein